MEEIRLNTIDEAIADFREGTMKIARTKVILLLRLKK